MCLICLEFEKQRMSVRDAKLALGEMRSTIGPAHAKEVEALIARAEQQAQAQQPAQAQAQAPQVQAQAQGQPADADDATD